jgi:hypothetical protein
MSKRITGLVSWRITTFRLREAGIPKDGTMAMPSSASTRARLSSSLISTLRRPRVRYPWPTMTGCARSVPITQLAARRASRHPVRRLRIRVHRSGPTDGRSLAAVIRHGDFRSHRSHRPGFAAPTRLSHGDRAQYSMGNSAALLARRACVP